MILEFLWLEEKLSSKQFNIKMEFYKVMRSIIEPKDNNGARSEQKVE